MSSSNSLNQKAEQIDVQVINEVGELNDSANFDETIAENQQQNEQTNIISEEMAGTILKLPFSLAANFWGDYWELSDGELALMQPSAAKVFSDLFGKYVDDYPEAYMLGIALITCIGSRAAKMAVEKRRNPVPETVVPMPVIYEDSDEV